MANLLNWLPLKIKQRKCEALLRGAAGWPVTTAKLLKSIVVLKDPLAEGETAFQDSQVESPYYFVLPGGYFGGHARSVPLSDSEAHRLLRLLPEDTEINVRYNPANLDETATLPGDNPGFAMTIWAG